MQSPAQQAIAMPNRITLVAHTRWDREWYEPFEVFRAHLVDMLDDALVQLERDPRLSFTLDGHVALVDDYLAVRPAAEARIRALVTAGRLHIGPWFTQADTLLTDGESLIRNLVSGLKRADQLGGAMRVGYMPDQFGHAAQVPQILRMCGIDGAVLWRGVGPERPPHAFRWRSPDGSAVSTVWLQDGYGSGRRFPSEPEAFASAIEASVSRLRDWLGEMPILIPIGDDHATLARWLPEAASTLRERFPGVTVEMGGYHDHLPHLGEIARTLTGELRSPAFAPVLAGVASARIREKQAAARAATMLLRYAEPLAAWEKIAGESSTASELIDRAWTQLLLNHAHDSAAGCGADAAHEDVRARYRWAEQLARAAIDRSLSKIAVEPQGAIVAFNPGPATAVATSRPTFRSPSPARSWRSAPTGSPRRCSCSTPSTKRRCSRASFSPAELGQYLGGLDPATPLFGKFLTGIATHVEAGGLLRLDVGLGERPAAPGALAADQQRVAKLLDDASRVKVILHAAAPTRPVLVQAGPAPAAGFLSIDVRPGQPPIEAPRAARSPNGHGICAGSISVSVAGDGAVCIRDERLGMVAVRANHLVDEGDRGDLYHFDPVGPSVRPGPAHVTVVEGGPVRARLRIEQDLDLPAALDATRRARITTLHPAKIVTEVTLHAGERRVEFTTTFENGACDHRLRAHVRVPMRCDRVEVEHGLAVTRRPIGADALGHGVERASPTGQHHAFVDVTDGTLGVALFSRGLPEHEVARDGDGTDLALTLLRSVGWLSRGDLSVIAQAAGPVIPTPAAQEPGKHRFEYALLLHEGDWEKGDVLSEALRYQAPPLAVRPTGTAHVASARPLVDTFPECVRVLATYPVTDGTLLRVCNASPREIEASISPGWPFSSVTPVDPLERALGPEQARSPVHFALRPFQIATLKVR